MEREADEVDVKIEVLDEAGTSDMVTSEVTGVFVGAAVRSEA
jgi:hypothetical protein